MTRRAPLLATGAAMAALGLTGCLPALTSTDAEQLHGLGDVALQSKTCDVPLLALFVGGGGPDPSGLFNDDDCFDAGPLLSAADADVPLTLPHQLLAAYRVPEGAEPPDEIRAEVDVIPFREFVPVNRGGEAGDDPDVQSQTVVFRRNDGYGQQLTDMIDAEREGDEEKVVQPGQKMVGYVSDIVEGVPLEQIETSAEFGLPAGKDGGRPFEGPFNSLQISGSRFAIGDEMHAYATEWFFSWLLNELGSSGNLKAERAVRQARGGFGGDLSPDREVRCADEGGDAFRDAHRAARGGGGIPPELLFLILLGLAGSDATNCGFPLPTADQPADLAYNKILEGLNLGTRDLRIAAGEGYGEQGTTAIVPFTLRAAGDSGLHLPMTASTTLEGVAQQTGTVEFPGTGEFAHPVEIAIPENAAPGTYPVRLKVGGDGVAQTATAMLVVLPKQSVASEESGDGPEQRTTVLMGDGGIVGMDCGTACAGQQGLLLASKQGISNTANTAAAKPRLLRITKKRTFRSSRAALRLFPKAQRAVRNGRAVKAILVTRKNGRGTPTVQRVLIKRAP